MVVDRQYEDGTDVDVYIAVTSSADVVSPGNMWIHLMITTCPFLAGSYETYESTFTGSTIGWAKCGQVISTFTITGSDVWEDGQRVTVKLRRIYSDVSEITAYIKFADFYYTVD